MEATQCPMKKSPNIRLTLRIPTGLPIPTYRPDRPSPLGRPATGQ